MRKCARVLYNRKDDINSKFFWFFLRCGSRMFIWDPDPNRIWDIYSGSETLVSTIIKNNSTNTKQMITSNKTCCASKIMAVNQVQIRWK
jgi:hypothetical protein